MLNKGKDFKEVSQYDVEIPQVVSETEAIIYDWVCNHFGQTEACDPSWNISLLAKHIDECKANGNYKQEYTVVYEPVE